MAARAGSALFALLVLATLALIGVYALNVARWPAAPDRGFILQADLGLHVVAQTRPLGEAAGLRAGDRILTLNGRGYERYREFLGILDFTPGGQNVYRVERGGETLEIAVPVRPLGLEIVLRHELPHTMLGLVFLAMGVLVFLMKPYEATSWAFFGMASLGAICFTYSRSPFLYDPVWLDEVFRISAFGVGAGMVQLALLFPLRREFVSRQPGWLALPYGVAAALLALSISRGGWQDDIGWVGKLLFVFPFACFLFFVGSAAQVAFATRSNAQRLQAVVIVTGSFIAFIVPLTDITFSALFGAKFFPDVVYSWLVFVALFPIAIGYAIVRHDLFEIDVIVRRTYGYLLSTGVVVLLYGTTVSTLNLLVGPSEIARSPFFTVAFVLAVVFLMQPLQGRIQGFVDRVFYRTQVDYRRTIADVTDHMTQLLEPELVRETLVASVVREMFLENGLLLAPEGQDAHFEVVMAAGKPPELRGLELDKGLLEALAEARVPVFRHEIELAPQYAGRREGMQATFDALSAELVMPMLYQGQLRAALSLGRKKSGRMFTREDVDLLRTLVAEGAVALENARLFDDLADSLKQVQLLESIRSGLSKFVPKTVQELLAEGEGAGGLFEKRERDLTVMFADMTGYTRLSSQLPHDQVNAIVERYFGAFLDEILRQGGDVNETAGDGLMVLFQDEDPERHARAAATAALGIQAITRVINAERAGEIPIGVHIGINSGIASVGATKIQGGGGHRWTYTASGPTTNVAARIGALGEEIAITEETRRRIGAGFRAESLGPKALKNVKDPIEVFRVTAGPAPAEAEAASVAEVPAEEPQAGGVEAAPPATPGPGRFVLSGVVRERESGRPLAGLVVRAFDKDLMSDDYLGSATTDGEGRYEVRFTADAFRDLFERHPDLFVRVYDAAGREVASTQDAVRWNAGASERLDVAVSSARLA
jgi:class 3 adenylate cyclase